VTTKVTRAVVSACVLLFVMGLLTNLFGRKIAEEVFKASAGRYDRLLADAAEHARMLSSDIERQYQIGQESSWSYDQESGILTFAFDAHNLDVRAEIVGSFSKESATWLWAWANSDVDEQLTAAARSVQALGERHGYRDLITPQWTASESDGWAMAAVALSVAGGAGLYSGDFGAGRVFFLIRSFAT
jgi:hypothetical protein